MEAKIILTGRNVDEYDRQRICAQILADLKQHEGLQAKGLRVLNVEIKDDVIAGPTAKRGNVSAYCVKCKTKVDVRSPSAFTMKNGRAATRGTCPTCGTRVFRIGAG